MFHPSPDALIRYGDGGLTPSQSIYIQAHLSDCEACRALCRRFAVPAPEMREARDPAQVCKPDPGLLEKIRGGIRSWHANTAERGWCEDMKNRVAEQLGPFLGYDGAHKLLQPVSGNGSNLLSTIEPVLAQFLGKKAAADLINRVVDKSIVRS